MDKVSDIQFAPLRSLDDFLLEAARFQLPNFNDFEKWGNRVVNNLLYYQTNYFLISAITFLGVGMAYPQNMIIGILTVVIGFVAFNQMSKIEGAVNTFKKSHPMLVAGGFFTGIVLILHLLGYLIIFLFGILLPFGITFVHASMRLRNMRNKITNKMEVIGLKKSPMGHFLSAMYLEPEVFN